METLDSAAVRLASLGQPHRLAIFRRLVVAGPVGMAAGDIATAMDMPASSLSFHLAHLKRAGLVTVRPDSRLRVYAANFSAMQALVDFLTENCCGGRECHSAGASTLEYASHG